MRMWFPISVTVSHCQKQKFSYSVGALAQMLSAPPIFFKHQITDILAQHVYSQLSEVSDKKGHGTSGPVGKTLSSM